MKKTKFMTRVAAVVFALAILFAMSVPAWAAPNTGSSAYASNGSTNSSYAKIEDNQFTLTKEIVLFNVDEAQIFEPNVVYSYSVAPVDVTDGTPTVTGLVLDDNTKTTTATVRDGVANAVTIQGRKVDQYNDTTASADYSVTGNSGASTTLTFGGDNGTKFSTLDEGTTVTTSNAGATNGKVATGYIDVTINPTTIYDANKGPGIYRYKISDTTADTTLLSAGVKRDASYVKDLYLDVYVKNNSTNDGFDVYGYVLFKEGATTDANKDLIIEYASGTEESVKVDGYTVLSEVTTADQYHTYNVQVTKTVTGAMADQRNLFPFQVDITNVANTITGYTQQVTSAADFYYAIKSNGTQGAAVTTKLDNAGAKTIGSATATVKDGLALKHGDDITITGLPVNAKVVVTEFNNTHDVYTASAKDESNAVLKVSNTNTPAATTNADSVTVDYQKTALLYEAKAIDYTTHKDIIAVTNAIETISPTGLAFRIAPYVLMLAAGVSLIVLFIKRKHEATDMI